MDIFGSSGGAVNGLALVAGHPEQVHTLVAHEPPSAQVLPDREPVMAACEGIHETYQREGFGPAMAKFIALVSYPGPIPAGFADQPGPDPASFGLPTEDDGSRDDPLVGLNMLSTPGYQHDFDALRAAPTRIVIGVGAQSAAMMAGRAGIAVAERLGTVPVTFPGGHDGFVGGEYGGKVEARYMMRSTDGLLESARICCPRGHWFNGPIGSLTVREPPAEPYPQLRRALCLQTQTGTNTAPPRLPPNRDGANGPSKRQPTSGPQRGPQAPGGPPGVTAPGNAEHARQRGER